MESNYYIYAHYRQDTNEVFYVGKGQSKRAWAKWGRNNYWHHIVHKCGYVVRIILDNLTENQAFNAETKLIKFYGRKDLGLGPLVNLTDGGEGTSNREYTELTKRKIGDKTLERISNGWVNPMKDKNHTEETIHKQRECKIGKYEDENNPNSKIVLDTQTGIFYMTMKEYAEVCDISSRYLGSMLRGDRKNKTNGKYV